MTLQHTATHCNTLQHTATHCNTLQHTATHCDTQGCECCQKCKSIIMSMTMQHTATYCNTLQHAATHYRILQYTGLRMLQVQFNYHVDDTGVSRVLPTHCNILQHSASASHLSFWWHWGQLCTATHCNTLQHTATHCNTLQHTATHCECCQCNSIITSMTLGLVMVWCERASCHTYECVMSHTWMRHITHVNASCHTYECVMSHV